MGRVRGVTPEEGPQIGWRHSEGEVWVEIVVEVGTEGEGRPGGRLPDANLGRCKPFCGAIELAQRDPAFTCGGHSKLLLGDEPISDTAKERILRDWRIERQIGGRRGVGTGVIPDLGVPIPTANVTDDAQLRIEEVGPCHEERYLVVPPRRPGIESQVAATASYFVAMAVGLCDRPRNTGLTVGARLAAGTMRCLRL